MRLAARLLGARRGQAAAPAARTLVLDCDGVLWRGSHVIPGAIETLAALRGAGRRLLFLTNNSSKSRAQYVEKFRALGVQVAADEVVSSSYAAAAYLASVGFGTPALQPGKRVLLLGTGGTRDELLGAGLEVVEPEQLHLPPQDSPDAMLRLQLDESIGAVVLAWDPAFSYSKLVLASACLRELPGCLFVVTNRDDADFIGRPANGGGGGGRMMPGTGALAAALEVAAGRRAVDVGKGGDWLLPFLQRAHGLDPRTSAVVGDRLDTDVAIGKRGGLVTLLPLTGVTSLADALAAGPGEAPDYPRPAPGRARSGVAMGTPPARHSNLYVANLPPSVSTEEDLRELFGPYGAIDTLRLVRNSRAPDGGKSFAFVKFASIPEALAAIEGLNGTQHGACTLEVKVADADAGDRNPELLAPPSDNLYAKNLPTTLTEGELRELFAPYGAVIECRVLHSGAGREAAGAGALVRMASVEEAGAAIANLHNRRMPGAPMPLVVRYADSQEQKQKKAARQVKQFDRYGFPGAPAAGPYAAQQPHAHLGGGGAGPPHHHHHHQPVGYYHQHSPVSPAGYAGGGVCSVYIKFLPETTDRLWLYEKFAPHGPVLSVKVLTNDAGACKGVGFINYGDADSALRAVAAMHGMPLGGDKRLYVALQTHRGGGGGGGGGARGGGYAGSHASSSHGGPGGGGGGGGYGGGHHGGGASYAGSASSGSHHHGGYGGGGGHAGGGGSSGHGGHGGGHGGGSGGHGAGGGGHGRGAGGGSGGHSSHAAAGGAHGGHAAAGYGGGGHAANHGGGGGHAANHGGGGGGAPH
ncbi:PGLP2 [Scenedesmus sp. PABB004]|nr:PGLP2 [Scenedesmus sp. PABB004]